MAESIGKKVWLIPDCFLPPTSCPGVYVSHEAFCVLNTGNEDAHMTLTLYYEDREPITSFSAFCGARRTNHVRLDKIKDKDGNGIIKDVPYAMLIESDVPVTIQYSRLDTTQPAMSLMTTIAYSK